jgi:hypothetical protein
MVSCCCCLLFFFRLVRLLEVQSRLAQRSSRDEATRFTRQLYYYHTFITASATCCRTAAVRHVLGNHVMCTNGIFFHVLVLYVWTNHQSFNHQSFNHQSPLRIFWIWNVKNEDGVILQFSEGKNWNEA